MVNEMILGGSQRIMGEVDFPKNKIPFKKGTFPGKDDPGKQRCVPIPCIAVITAICILSEVFYPVSVVSSSQVFTMKQALQIGLKNCNELFQIRSKLAKKRIELVQTRQGISDMRQKEKTIKFSLLFNLQFSEGRGMPKEIELVTKIPKVVGEIEELKRNNEYTQRKVECDIAVAYLSVAAEMINIENRQMVLDEENKTLAMLEKRFKTGEATAEQLKIKREQVALAVQALQSAKLNFESEKEKLSDIIGTDVTSEYDFERKFITADLERNDLDGIISHSKVNSLEVFKARSNLRNSEVKVQLARAIYRDVFGLDVSMAEAELNKPGDIDYERIMDKYEQNLEIIRSKWDGFFFIPLYFFVIPIPKSWIQPGYAGTRYFENEKYALPLAIIDREIERKETEKIIKSHERNVSAGFRLLKEMEDAYVMSVDNYNTSQDEYKKALVLNKTGRLSLEELEGIKGDIMAKEANAVNNLVEYNKQIYRYNFQTSDAIRKFYGKTAISIGMLGTGMSFVTEPENEGSNELIEAQEGKNTSGELSENAGKWYIDSSNIDYKVYFRVSIPESLGITHFALFTDKHLQIGVKTEISAAIPHIPILINDTGILNVELYRGDKLAGTATLDGFDVDGDLIIRLTPSTEEDDGSFKVKE